MMYQNAIEQSCYTALAHEGITNIQVQRSDRLGKIHNQPSWEASACSLATASAITRRNHSERLDLLRT